MNKKKTDINGLSLFANVGIAEVYINKYINIKIANELVKKRAKFYSELYPSTIMIQGNILDDNIFRKIIKNSIKEKCNFIIATPPCQGMSLAGKMSEDDPRNSLIIKVVEAIKIIKPKYFIIENVQRMPKTYIKFKGKKNRISDFLTNELSSDYNINFHILDSADYGTPQTRKRSIILGSDLKSKVWPKPKKFKTTISVKDAISHLPSLESNQKSEIKYHYAKKQNDNHILWLKNTPSGKTAFLNKIHYPKKNDGTKIKGYLTTYKRIEWNKPAPTITMCNGAVSSQNNVHPGRLMKNGEYSDARVLTLKEIFILSGLPENWSPPNWASENMIREVIGEGVPPKLIEAILKSMP
jgi:DNA (cytosine-5)-methyltransferase 1